MVKASIKKGDDSARIVSAWKAVCPSNLLAFLHGIRIAGAHGPVTFGNCMADFQLDVFRSIAPSLHAVRDGKMPPKRRFWIERTKKAGKDSDLAAMMLWLLAFPERPIYLQAGAGSRDQAAIVRQRIEDLLYYNDWLREFVEVNNWKVQHRGGLAEMDIITSDESSAHGANPDVMLINELVHIRRWGFVRNLMNNADGVPQGVVIVATNAGFVATEAAAFKEAVKASPLWTIHQWAEPAPWHSPELIEDAKLRDTPSEHARLWYGRWASGTGDSLGRNVIDRCFRDDLGPITKPEPNWRYIAGLDLGVKQDHSGLVMVGVQAIEQRLRVCWLKGWAPGALSKMVDLGEVRETCAWLSRTFRLEWLGFDPTQAMLMAQDLVRLGVPMREVSFSSPASRSLMAQSLMQVLESGVLECYDDEEGRLRRDLGKMSIVAKPGRGYRIEAAVDKHGHADVGTALAICLPRAMAMLGSMRPALQPDDVLVVDDEPLSLEEYVAMPKELQEICESAWPRRASVVRPLGDYGLDWDGD